MRAWKLSVRTKNCNSPQRTCCAKYRELRCRLISSISKECGRSIWLSRLSPDDHDAHFQGLLGPCAGECAARSSPGIANGVSVVRDGAAKNIADVIWLRRDLRNDTNAYGIHGLRGRRRHRRYLHRV